MKGDKFLFLKLSHQLQHLLTSITLQKLLLFVNYLTRLINVLTCFKNRNMHFSRPDKCQVLYARVIGLANRPWLSLEQTVRLRCQEDHP